MKKFFRTMCIYLSFACGMLLMMNDRVNVLNLVGFTMCMCWLVYCIHLTYDELIEFLGVEWLCSKIEGLDRFFEDEEKESENLEEDD